MAQPSGGIQSVSLHERSVPQPIGSQIRIRIGAVGLNHADLTRLEGHNTHPSDAEFIPGMEVAGIVEERGPDAFGVFPGDVVMAWMPYGGLAEEAIVESGCCWVAPHSLTMPQIAAYPLAYGTSYMALMSRARLQAGDVLLVIGAGGAVGQAALTLGRLNGAITIAAAGSKEKCDFALEQGADYAVNWQDEDLGKKLAELKLNPDICLDTVGGDVFVRSLDTMAPEGRVIPIGYMGGEIQNVHADELQQRNLDLIGFELSGYLPQHWERVRKSFSALAEYVRDGRLIPFVGHVFPFSDVPEALSLLSSGKRMGKVVVQISD